MKLLDESSNSSSSDEEDQPQERLQINQKFAGEFERRQRFKDLQRAKELLAMDGAEEEVDSEDEESEDEDAELLSPGLDLKIIQTINQIRKKDPKIYDKSVQFFEQKDGPNGDDDSEEDGEKQGKKKRYKDVLREQLLQGGADMESSDEEGGKSRQLQTANKKQLVYDREQEDIRKAFLAAAKGSDQEDSDEEVGDVLKVKKKSAAEQAKEEEELKRALQEMKTLAKDEEADKEDFLTTYFTNKMWKDTTGKKKSSNFGNSDDESEDFEHDENALEEAELFESKYNFRFEEMQDERERREKQGNIIGAADTAYQVVGHARNVQGTLRRQDDSRKLQREQRKERKEKEKRQKEEELKRLKNLKKQELQERLSKIGEMGGLKQLGIDENFLDEDWDPAKHEALMQQQFNDDYYHDEDENFVANNADEGLGDIIGDDMEGDEGYYENGDDNYGEEVQGDGRAHFASEEDYQTAKGAVKNMMDELYQLDYEDIVAGIPCRFKYKQVEPEDFGLTTDEILMADDAELNRFVSLKHIAPYQQNKWSKSERDIAKRRKRLRLTLRDKMKGQVEEQDKNVEEGSEKKKKNHDKAEVQVEVEEVAADAEQQKHKRKRRKRKGDENADGESTSVQVISKATEPAYKPALVAKEAATEDKKKFRDHKKKQKSSKKKEESDPKKKRLNLYN